jgi:type I restriction enzyme S subunit
MELKPGYKQTEIGVIPEEWVVENLGDLVDYIKGFAFRSDQYTKDGIRIIRVSDTSYDSILDKNSVFLPESEAKHYSKWRLKTNDLIVSTVGSKPPMYDSMVGKVNLVSKKNEGALLNQNAVLLRDKRRRSHVQKILLGHFRSRRYLAWIESIYRGNANQASITLKELFSFPVALPTDDTEQRAIAEALSDMDALLSVLDQLIAKKSDLKQATMQQLLTGQTRLPGFHGEWEVKTLADVTDTDPENLGSNTCSDYVFNYISLEDVDHGVLRSYSEHVFNRAPSRARRKLRIEDVLVSTVRPNLKSHLLFREAGDNWVCSTGFCVVRCRKGVTDPRYVFFHLFAASVNRQIEALLTGSNYPAINSGDVRALEIPFPEYNEQTAIGEVLTDMEAELASLEKRREKTRDLKQAMMQELLTGRTRLMSPEESYA